MTMRRIIQEVIFDDLGPLSIADLLKMQRPSWEALRAGITDQRSGKPGLIARCLLCQREVFVRTAKGVNFHAEVSQVFHREVSHL